jgi:signal transduction histidine kinase
VEIQTGMDAGFANVSVLDHGPGIPPEDLEQIFDRFYQSDKSRRRDTNHGFGLGLPIAREIVHAHGGSLTVKNNFPTSVDSGSTFLVRLPLALPGELSSLQKSQANQIV